MENSCSPLMSRRELSSVSQFSPCIIRSKSVTTRPTLTATAPESNFSGRYSSKSQRFTESDSDRRSKSTTKVRPTNKHGEENAISASTATASTVNKKKQQENKESTVFWNKWRSDHPEYSVRATRKATSVTVSPSAWALSPGRSLFGSPARPADHQSSSQVKQSKNGGVKGVMKYFKQMKLSSSFEEKEHRHLFKVLHNRLLQWRFVNARAAAAMESVEKVAELKVFAVWLNIFMLRKKMVKKKIEVEKLKHGMKLFQIIIPQVFLMNDWTKILRRNQESVASLTRILTILSVRLPLVHGAKANVASLCQAMNTAMQLIDSIQLVTEFYNRQVEKNVEHLAQLITTYQKEEHCIMELQKLTSHISTIFNREKSVMIHVMQAESEMRKALKSIYPIAC